MLAAIYEYNCDDLCISPMCHIVERAQYTSLGCVCPAVRVCVRVCLCKFIDMGLNLIWTVAPIRDADLQQLQHFFSTSCELDSFENRKKTNSD